MSEINSVLRPIPTFSARGMIGSGFVEQVVGCYALGILISYEGNSPNLYLNSSYHVNVENLMFYQYNSPYGSPNMSYHVGRFLG